MNQSCNPHLAGRDDSDSVSQASTDEQVVHEREALDERRAHVIGVFGRGRASPTLATIDRDEICK